MPIYEFACPDCRMIFSFLARRAGVTKKPACPKCGRRPLSKQISRFSPLSSARAEGDAQSQEPDAASGLPDVNDPKIARLMSIMERDMQQLDENNPRHIAHLLRKMKQALPDTFASKDIEIALKRLEAGEDPESIEADMGDVLDSFMNQNAGSKRTRSAQYTRDPQLYDL